MISIPNFAARAKEAERAYIDIRNELHEIEDLICYPGEWDTAAYPTLKDAIQECIDSQVLFYFASKKER